MGKPRPLFVDFCSFLIKISIIQIEKSIGGVLGIQTRGHRMVGADEPRSYVLLPVYCAFDGDPRNEDAVASINAVPFPDVQSQSLSGPLHNLDEARRRVRILK